MARRVSQLSAVLEGRIREVMSLFGEAVEAAQQEASGYEDILSTMDTSDNFLENFHTDIHALLHFMLEEDALKYLELFGFILKAAMITMHEASATAVIIKAYKELEYEITAGARAPRPSDGSEPAHFLDVVAPQFTRSSPIVVPSGRLTTIEHVAETLMSIDCKCRYETEEEICETANAYIEVLTLEGLI